MSERAIFQATFADFKVIKTRSTAQFVFEVPLEGADKALAALDGVPRPDKEVWVVVARLAHQAATEAPKAPDKSKYSLARQAAMLCNVKRFQTFPAGRRAADSQDTKDTP